MKVLLVQLRQLGDILLTTPCIKAIKTNYPEAQIHFLSHAMGKMILGNNPHLDQLWTYKESDTLSSHWRLIKKLRAENYTHAFDFMNNPRSALLTLMSGAQERWGFQSARSWCYNHRIPKIQDHLYIVEEKMALLQTRAMAHSDLMNDLPWEAQDKQPVQSLNLPEQGYRIVLSPTHRRPMRRWLAERWVELADRLMEQGNSVTWIWGPGELEEVQGLQEQTQSPSFLAPKTTFAELAALLAHVDLFIGTSNGPSHVATAAGTCSLQLHGHTKAKSWSPSTARHHWIQSSNHRSGNPTLDPIQVADVLETFQRMESELAKQKEFRLRQGDDLVWNQRLGL